jgi:hypothetical protein
LFFLYFIKRKAKWIGQILRRIWFLQRVIDRKLKGVTEVTGRRGRSRWKLLDELKERKSYAHLKEETLDRTMWRDRFWRGFRTVVRQSTKWINILWQHWKKFHVFNTKSVHKLFVSFYNNNNIMLLKIIYYKKVKLNRRKKK